MSTVPPVDEESLGTVADRLLALDEPQSNQEGAVVQRETHGDTIADNAESPSTVPASAEDASPPHLPPGPTASKARALAAGQVNRIVEDALPEGMHLSRDARVAFQKAATVTLFYLACLAEESRKQSKVKRSTLTVQDIHAALDLAGMAHLTPQMHVPTKRGRRP